jgi:tetratricopeptide (TPR) repeat protein
MFFDSEKKLLRTLEKQKKSGEEYQIQEALGDLANFYREKKDWPNLKKISEESHARHMVEENPQQVLIYLAGSLSDAGMHEEAAAYMDKVKVDYEKVGLKLCADFYTTLIALHLAQEDYVSAVDACRAAVDLNKDHPHYSDFWETQAQLADLIQYKLKDTQGCIPEREILWRHFRKTLDAKKELSYNAAMVHVASGARYAYGLSQVDPAKAHTIYAPLIEDLKISRWFGPDCAEIPTLREAWEACEKKLP